MGGFVGAEEIETQLFQGGASEFQDGAWGESSEPRSRARV